MTDEEREKIEACWAEIEAEENEPTREERAQELAYWKTMLMADKGGLKPPRTGG